jgi:AraC-like DNA-binding protein
LHELVEGHVEKGNVQFPDAPFFVASRFDHHGLLLESDSVCSSVREANTFDSVRAVCQSPEPFQSGAFWFLLGSAVADESRAFTVRRAWLFQIARAFQVWAGTAAEESEPALRQRMSALPPPMTRLETLVLRGLSTELFENFAAVERARHVAEEPQVVHRARQYLETHYAEHVTIAAVSRSLGCSRAQLTRAFRSALGRSIHDYLTEIRVRRAVRALRDSSEKVESIALMVGYKSKKDLYRAVRAITGLTPKGFRIEHTISR